MSNKENSRRSAIKSLFTTVMAVGATMFGLTQLSSCNDENKSKSNNEILNNPDSETSNLPYWSEWISYNGLVYIAGKGVHFEGDITEHTTATLNLIEELLEEAGSSMDKVLKVNVYLHDIGDYEAMNEAYLGRFGDQPPVRTTVACSGGIPGNALIEIDAIAALDE